MDFGGHEKEIFLDQKEAEKYICAFCTAVIKDAVETKCGHLFCDSCMKESLKRHNYKCPIDNKFVMEHMIHPAYFIRRELNNLEVKCINNEKGCEWKGSLIKIPTHEEICLYKEEKCALCSMKMFKKDIKTHNDDECKYRSVRCDKCEKRVLFLTLEKHYESICDVTIVTCKNNCGIEDMKRSEMIIHIEKHCPNEIVDCIWSSFGCKFREKRSLMKKHAYDDEKIHYNKIYSLVNYMIKKNPRLSSEILPDVNTFVDREVINEDLIDGQQITHYDILGINVIDIPGNGVSVTSLGILNNYIVSGHSDGSLAIWDSTDGSFFDRFYNEDLKEREPIRNMVCYKNNIVYSIKESIYFWQLSNIGLITLKKKVKEHKDDVTGLTFLRDNILVSCSLDGTVKVWFSNIYYCKSTIIESQPIRCMDKIDYDRVVIGMDYSKSYILNVDTEEKTRIIFDVILRVSSCIKYIPENTTVYSGFVDGKIAYVDTEIDEKDMLDGHNITITDLRSSINGELISCSNEKKIVIWNNLDDDKREISTSQNIMSLEILSNGYIVSGSEDGSIQIWK
jgi:WD40 repeat protein